MSEPLEKKVCYYIERLVCNDDWWAILFDYNDFADAWNKLREMRAGEPKTTFRLRKKTDEVLNL